MANKPPFETEATFYLRYDPEHTEAVHQAINEANRSWAEDVTGTSSMKSMDEDLDKKIAELEKKNDALRSELNMNTKIASKFLDSSLHHFISDIRIVDRNKCCCLTGRQELECADQSFIRRLKVESGVGGSSPRSFRQSS